MAQSSEQQPSGYVKVNHELGFFLDPEKYAPLLKISDEASVMLRLCLIAENFLEVFINNIRKPGTEAFVKPARYFKPKLELSVALGLPIPIADALVAVNALRNKFAHKIDYSMTTGDYAELEKIVDNINIETVNSEGGFNLESIQAMFDIGVESLMFIRNQQYSLSEKQKKLQRLVGTVFILANKCAFFTLNELKRQGRLDASPRPSTCA